MIVRKPIYLSMDEAVDIAGAYLAMGVLADASGSWNEDIFWSLDDFVRSFEESEDDEAA